MNEPLKKACKIVGSLNKMANALGASRQSIYYWMSHRVPANRVIPIEDLTDGQVTRHELRPDIYPE